MEERKAVWWGRWKWPPLYPPQHLLASSVRYRARSIAIRRNATASLTFAHLHLSLWKLVTAAPDSKALGSSAPALPTLNPRLADTSPELCHTWTHDVATAGPPPPHTSTSRCILQKRARASVRLQRGEGQPHNSTNKPKLHCSHYSATNWCCLMQSFWYQR